jgi:hypothetical protein
MRSIFFIIAMVETIFGFTGIAAGADPSLKLFLHLHDACSPPYLVLSFSKKLIDLSFFLFYLL